MLLNGLANLLLSTKQKTLFSLKSHAMFWGDSLFKVTGTYCIYLCGRKPQSVVESNFCNTSKILLYMELTLDNINQVFNSVTSLI